MFTIYTINKIKHDSGPFQSWHIIAQHCEIHFEYYLNEKRAQLSSKPDQTGIWTIPILKLLHSIVKLGKVIKGLLCTIDQTLKVDFISDRG